MWGVKKKAHLLEKYEQGGVDEEWIEMEDCRQPEAHFAQKHQPSSHHYQRIDNPYRQYCRRYEQAPGQPMPEAVVGEPYSDKIIKMNGAVFKLVEKDAPPKKPSKIPPMHVECCYCAVVQAVPGTSELFTCGGCGMMNECTPAYSLIRCSNCRGKVLYATGTSLNIKCTRCHTINRVQPQFKENPYELHPNKENPYIDPTRHPSHPPKDKEEDFEFLSQLSEFEARPIAPDHGSTAYPQI